MSQGQVFDNVNAEIYGILMIFKSFTNSTDHLTLLSYDGWDWDDRNHIEFAYYRDLYIGNQKNFSDEFIITTPARAPANYFSNG